MNTARTLGLSTVILSLVVWTSASAEEKPQFADFAVTEIYNGPPSAIVEATAPDNWLAIRQIDKELMAEGMAKGPNFAGSFYLATVPCGTGCEAVFVINMRTGQIHTAPEAASNGVYFQKDSQLILFKENPQYNLPRFNMLFDGQQFLKIN